MAVCKKLSGWHAIIEEDCTLSWLGNIGDCWLCDRHCIGWQVLPGHHMVTVRPAAPMFANVCQWGLLSAIFKSTTKQTNVGNFLYGFIGYISRIPSRRETFTLIMLLH